MPSRALSSPLRTVVVSALAGILLGLAAIGAAWAAGLGSMLAQQAEPPLLAHAARPTRAAAAARPQTATVEFVAGGDVALAAQPAPDALAAISRFLRPADIALANLEGTLTTGGSPRCVASPDRGCFTFAASPRWAATLRRTGFRLLSVANNHALDFGREGQRETLAALQRSHLAYSGLPGQISYLRASGLTVGVVACAPYGWAQDLRDPAATAALVRTAGRRADIVVVYMHAGAEGSNAQHVADREETYLGERRGNPIALAHQAIDAGADLVLASGPHVLRGLQWHRGHLIAYSLGNLAGTHTLSTRGDLGTSILLRIKLDEHGRFASGSLIPLRLDTTGRPSPDPSRRGIR